MKLRSLLFVPADRPERMEKALMMNADALILDLEDSVSLDRKNHARSELTAFLKQSSGPKKLFVRINPLDSGMLDEDLKVILAGLPDGIILPKAEGGGSLAKLDALLNAAAVEMSIIVIATETPAAIFQLGSYGGITKRLAGITWGAEDLPAAIGAATSREDDGSYTPPYQLARSLTLFGAHAAGVAAIETVYPDFKDIAGLGRYVARAARDGFTGMMAIHPSQVDVINAGFMPSAAAIQHAKDVVAMFRENPGTGAIALNGKMIDLPHLKQAKRILDNAPDSP